MEILPVHNVKFLMLQHVFLNIKPLNVILDIMLDRLDSVTHVQLINNIAPVKEPL